MENDKFEVSDPPLPPPNPPPPAQKKKKRRVDKIFKKRCGAYSSKYGMLGISLFLYRPGCVKGMEEVGGPEGGGGGCHGPGDESGEERVAG